MLNKSLLFIFLMLNICFIIEGFLFKFCNKYTKLIVFNRKRYWEKLNSIPKGEERLKYGLNGTYDYWIPEFIGVLGVSCVVGLIFLVTQRKINFVSWLQVLILVFFYGVISFGRYSKEKDNKFIIRRTRDLIREAKLYYFYVIFVVFQTIILVLK